ncbi:hypothetical protein DMB38_20290 [Streptomyces sp. WAC 06738]|uniref:hypothetical protein n=1 Tax=Streptomyces sp. WAC 06738 TaxID=2203210 RepID=UPI000F706A41|nr:hypothetical protein [Streptomyces sp. WAC 06738]AZM47816.1 hypothetical protein DMB38_20290 [Streptomyces sp. WAC 06738]
MAETKSLAALEEAPARGSWYQLLSDFGEGVGMLTKTHRYRLSDSDDVQESDRMLLVLAIVEPASYGVGYSPEYTVVAMWLEQTAPGRFSQHHISFPMTQFTEIVGPGEEPPEYADWQAQQAGE